MPDGSLPSPAPTASRALSAASFSWIAGWTLSATFVLLFVAIQYQPHVTRGSASVRLVDLALLGAVLVAALELRHGSRRLDGSRWLWVAACAFLAFVAAASLYPLAFDDRYDWTTHLVTAARYAVYALIAPAVAVLARDVRALQRLWATVVVWAVVAGAVALAQFVGVDIFDAWPAGIRQPSFTGIPELGALGGAAIAIGFLGVLWPGSVPRAVWVAGLVGGTLDVVISGGVAGQIGLVGAAVAAIALAGRRLGNTPRSIAAVVLVTVLCGVGVAALRGADLTQYARHLGLTTQNQEASGDVETYAHRELIYYIGLRVWLDRPLLGAGWQSIHEQHVYAPFLDDAHRRYPDEPQQAFPSRERDYGIDNAYIQTLAELGLVGLGLFLTLLAIGLVQGTTRALRAPPLRAQQALVGVLWLLVVMGTWAGQGLGAGSAFAGLSWFALGLIAAAGTPSGA